MDFIDKPDQKSFLNAFQILIKLGAVDSGNASLTSLGKEMAVLPTETIYSKLLMVSLKPEYISISKKIASIVSMLSVENIFYNPPGGHDIESKILKKRSKLFNPQSDHLTLLKIIETFREVSKKQGKSAGRSFCREYFINEKSVFKAL